MIVGFTGTREGITDLQLGWLYTILESAIDPITEVHHGACIGADAAVHAAALAQHIPVHVWPPIKQQYMDFDCIEPNRLVTVHPAMPYLNRDREIVRASEGLIALPKQEVQPERVSWGGTWYTVDFAERMNKPVVICNPKGVVSQRLPVIRGA